MWNGVRFAMLRHVFPLTENEKLFDEEVRGQLQELFMGFTLMMRWMRGMINVMS